MTISNPVSGLKFHSDFMSGALDSRLTLTRAAGAGSYYDSNGIIQTAGTNVARFDYDPSTLALKGLLLEKGATNYAFYSSDIGNAYWAAYQVRATASSNATTSPDGTVNAGVLTEDTSNNTHYLEQSDILLSSDETRTYSVYAKPNGRTNFRMEVASNVSASGGRVIFTLTGAGSAGGFTPLGGGVLVTKSIQALPDGWYRCSVTLTPASSGNTKNYFGLMLMSDSSTVSYQGDGTSGIFFYGMEIKVESFPSSYIPTTTASANRYADVLLCSSVPWFNANAGSMVAQFIASNTTSYNQILSFDDTSFSNRISLSNSSGTGRVEVTSGGTNSVLTLQVGTIAAGSVTKAGMTYQNAVNIAEVGVNGTTAAGNGSGTGIWVAPVGISEMCIGNRNAGNTPFSGWMQRINYWNVALTDAALKVVTT